MTYIAHRAYRADIPIKLATTMASGIRIKYAIHRLYMAILVRDAHAYVWHVAEVVSTLFSHTSAIFTYNEGL